MTPMVPTNGHGTPPRPGPGAVLQSFSKGAAIAVLVLAVMVLVGWSFGIETLKRVVPGIVAMNPMTAVCFLLGGGSLALLNGEGAGRQLLSRLVAATALLIGLLKLLSILTGWNLGIDQLLFSTRLDIDPVMPNRMAPTTAICFVLSSLALLSSGSGKASRIPFFQLASLLVVVISLLALVGYGYGVRKLTGFAAYIPMALHTAGGFLLLACGTICSRPREGLTRRLISPGAGGVLVRRLLAVIVLVPLALGWIILVGRGPGGYNLEFGFAILVVLILLVFSVVIWASAGALDRKETERNDAQADLRRAHEELESRVEKRTRDLARILTRLQPGIDVLASSAAEIVRSASGMAGRAGETAEAVAETTTTAEEIRHTAEAASEKAREVSDMAHQVKQTAHAGQNAIEAAEEGMQRIRDQMAAIDAEMKRLTEHSRAIGKIVATVDDLAEQSRVLAINASIEAAKAGEYGRGFSVVADEVRSLANQSRSATEQVRKILMDIQTATRAAAVATEHGGNAVKAGADQSTRAGESIHSLAGSIDDAVQAAIQIAAASRQQFAGMHQMAEALKQIQKASGGNAESARGLEEAARKLDDLGKELRSIVEEYKAKAVSHPS